MTPVYRVLRGASHFHPAHINSAPLRRRARPPVAYEYFGLRLACSAPAEVAPC